MIWAIAIIIASQLLLLVAMVRPSGVLMWLVLLMIAVLVAYLVAICFGLLKLVKKNNPNE